MWAGRRTLDGVVILTNASHGWNVGNQVLFEWMAWKSGKPTPIKKSVAAAILSALHRGGAAAAVTKYSELKRTRADDFMFLEGELNRLGYALLHRKRLADAVSIFELNTREYPVAWNSHDSLGDAYAAARDTTAALRSYRRPLALNPDNANAKRMIETLDKR